MKVAIIGAGASGLMAGAYLYSNSKIEYQIFERNSQPGRKILASGNGRCNLSNKNLSKDKYYNSDHFDFDYEAWNKFLALNNFLTVFDNEGRMYPFSNSSKTVLDFLLAKNKSNSISYDSEVTSISKRNNKYLINGHEFDRVIIASGSIASIITKKQKGIYDYLASLNLEMTKLKPSLSGFKIENPLKALSGIRVPVLAKVIVDSKIYHEEYGEMIFKDDGISGIAIMNLSFYYNHLKNMTISLELYPELAKESLNSYLNTKDRLKYIVNPKLWDYLKDFKNSEILSFLKDFRPVIISTYGFSDSQVVSGGIAIKEVNSDFSLRKDPNIYAVGEALDVDGLCGGFNLAFAFNSGITAAKNIIKNNKS